ncbi:SAM-dependent methyltransferase [Crossiella equi]|uniref:SAM-dependent methyltransferase n=1 Tax=Crossiella equi TaxID=130796 RepID=A0ABS5A865_9PSEU|nr:class I SAM-dependent methyltransferase [Crossiella equi]MBP2472777.1 SAM-dependent methyltransferase [Crossiella equi]
MSGEFDAALLGLADRLQLPGGRSVTLPVTRWQHGPGAADESLLRRCGGPVLDIGCGPGRLVAALAQRGVVALGVDSSPVAVRLATARGAVALCRDVFQRLPGEGRWREVLLADGNIGIGGDPVVLLRRVHGLLAADGTARVEVDPPGTGLDRARVCLAGTDFDWAWVGADAIGLLAAVCGFTVTALVQHSGRWFAVLRKEVVRDAVA